MSDSLLHQSEHDPWDDTWVCQLRIRGVGDVLRVSYQTRKLLKPSPHRRRASHQRAAGNSGPVGAALRTKENWIPIRLVRSCGDQTVQNVAQSGTVASSGLFGNYPTPSKSLSKERSERPTCRAWCWWWCIGLGKLNMPNVGAQLEIREAEMKK